MSRPYLLTGGVWLLAGPAAAAPTGPLAPGTYQPGPTSSGVPAGVALTPHYGNITTTANNQTFDALDVTGRIINQHRGTIVTRCRLRGNGKVPGTSSWGLFDCQHPNVLDAHISDSDLVLDPTSVSPGWTGVIGHDYTALRCNLAHLVDAFGAYNNVNKAQDLNVTIAANYAHDFAMLSPDPNQHDVVNGQPVGWTHNDGIQIQGVGATVGKLQVHSIGNNLVMRCSPLVADGGVSNFKTAWWPSVTAQGIGITPNVTQIHDVLSEYDWIDYGQHSVSVALNSKGVGTGIAFRKGRYGRNQPVIGGVRRAMQIDPSVVIPDLPSTTGPDVKGAGNVYADDGTPIIVYRA